MYSRQSIENPPFILVYLSSILPLSLGVYLSSGNYQKRTPEMTMQMHTGNNQDFQAYVMFVPEKKYGLVVFTNSAKMIQ